MDRPFKAKLPGWQCQAVALIAAAAALWALFGPSVSGAWSWLGAIGGGAVAVAAVSCSAFTDSNRYRLFPTLLTIGIATCSLGLAEFLANSEDSYLRTLVSEQAKLVQSRLEFELNEVTNALRRYATRAEYVGLRDEKFLELDGASYIAQVRSLRRLGLVDERLIVRWSYPKAIAGQVQGFDQSSDEERRAAFFDAISRDKPSISRMIDLRSGEKGFLIPVPMHNKAGHSMGALYGTISASKLFAEVTRDLAARVRIYDRAHDLFVSEAMGLKDYKQTSSFHSGLADWDIEVSPTRAFVAQNTSGLPNEVRGLGILLALLIGGIVQFGARNSRQNKVGQSWRNAVLDDAHYALISTDVDGIVQTFNASAERMLGYKAGEIIGRTTPGIFHLPEEIAARKKTLSAELGMAIDNDFHVFTERSRRMGVADENDWTYVRKDGSHLPVRLSVTTMKSSTGRVYGYLGIAVDRSERIRAEAELHRTSDRLERVMEATGSGIWERQNDSKMPSYFDQRGRDLFGLGKDEPATEERMASLIDPVDLQEVAARIDTHIVQRTPRYVVEFRVRHPSMGERWIRSIGQAHRVPGRPDTITATISDVTVEVKTRQRLERALAEARSATEAKTSFVANMSHEIRTPLNGILGLTRLVQASNLDDEQRENLDSVVRSGEHLLTIINDILDFAKLDAGKMLIDTIDFDLARLLEDTQKILIHSARDKKIALVFELPKTLDPNLRGDPGRLGQIVINLIGNAIKFTSEGEVRLKVSQRTWRPDEYRVRFEVSDTGIGIAPEAKARVFQAFSQADISTSRNYGGTGLGLSISKRLVEMMNGQIGVESELGRGSTFWFEIPLKRNLGTAATAPAANPSVRTSFAAKILVAEDNLINQKVAVATLRKLGYHTSVVVNGREALDALDQDRYDLILMDCQMPGLDGYEATRVIRRSADAARANIPIIAMTANALGGEREKCLAAGMNDYIAKPFDVGTLHAMIERNLGAAR